MATKKQEIVKEEDIKSEQKRSRIYISYSTRLVFCICIVIILIVGLIYSLSMSFSITKKDTIKYNEKGNIDYKVYLKDNLFYDEEYLNEGMVYVASLIDKIKIDYHYAFNINKKTDMDITYKIVGRLKIKNTNEENSFFEKDYDLSKEVTRNLNNIDEYKIDESISIDYDLYNDLATKFKSNYALNTSSYLDVYLEVNEKNKNTKDYVLNNTSKSILSIPLSKQEVNIKLDNKEVNQSKEINIEPDFMINNKLYLIISAVIFLLLVISLLKLFSKLSELFKKQTTYEKYLNKILRAYDRIIVNVKTCPDMEKYEVLEVENFDDLIDISDNIKQPIKHIVISKGNKSKFFIIDDQILYLYIIKSSDINEENKK